MNLSNKLSLNAINRYPIKGFSVDTVKQIMLQKGKVLLHDRKYSFQNGEIDFDEYDPQHFFKTKFLVLMDNKKVASLQTSFDANCEYLTIKKDGQIIAEGDLTSGSDRRDIDFFINDYFDVELKGESKILIPEDEDHSFSDVKHRCISILNLESVKKFEQDTGLNIDPIRFRCNLHINGLAPFEELNMLEQSLNIGDARLKIFKKIQRCPAVDVNPTTANRDSDLNSLLKKFYDHRFMGVYAMVETGGMINQGDDISIL